MSVSTNNGLVNGPVHNLLMQFFTLDSSKIEVFETCFFGSRLHRVCMGRSGTSAHAVYALFSHLCYVGGFGNLGEPVVPTPRGASGDVVTVYAY